MTRFLSHVAETIPFKQKHAFENISEMRTHKTSLKLGVICQSIGRTMDLLFVLDVKNFIFSMIFFTSCTLSWQNAGFSEDKAMAVEVRVRKRPGSSPSQETQVVPA